MVVKEKGQNQMEPQIPRTLPPSHQENFLGIVLYPYDSNPSCPFLFEVAPCVWPMTLHS